MPALEDYLIVSEYPQQTVDRMVMAFRGGRTPAMLPPPR